jgi:hypothetical protein
MSGTSPIYTFQLSPLPPLPPKRNSASEFGALFAIPNFFAVRLNQIQLTGGGGLVVVEVVCRYQKDNIRKITYRNLVVLLVTKMRRKQIRKKNSKYPGFFELEITKSYQNCNFLPTRLSSISKRYQNGNAEPVELKKRIQRKPFLKDLNIGN